MYNIIVSPRHYFKRECFGIVCCFFRIPNNGSINQLETMVFPGV